MAESQNIEYKESWRDEYLRWICGFANAQGGKIFIGKDDNGNVRDLSNSKRLLEDIPNKIRNTLGIVADVNLCPTPDGDYIEIIVEPQPYPISYYGEYHYRSGSTKQQLTGQQLNQFLLKKTGVTWDSAPMAVKPSDLRFDSFDIFRERAVKSRRMSAENVNIDSVQLLDSLNLLEGGNLKRAGVLLFHHNPEKWVPGSYIKIGYFSSETELVYQDEIHGSLLSQAEYTVDLIYTKYLKGIVSYEGISRIETYPYPREAVREAVLNAIAHKNYATLIPIQIQIFDDKLIISNDSVFPEDWTMEDFLGKHRSRPYNPLIANTFYRAGFIEAWGRGIQKINDSCRKSGNKEPFFQIKKDEMTVFFEAKMSSAESETLNDSAKILIETEKPKSEAEKTEAGTEKPKVGTEKPEAGTEKPEAGTEKPEAGTEKPEAGTEKPEAEAEKPEAIAKNLEAEELSAILRSKGANQPTIDHLCYILDVKGYESFTSGDVVTLLNCAQSTASDFIKKMRDKYGVITPDPSGSKNGYCIVRIEDDLR